MHRKNFFGSAGALPSKTIRQSLLPIRRCFTIRQSLLAVHYSLLAIRYSLPFYHSLLATRPHYSPLGQHKFWWDFAPEPPVLCLCLVT